MKNKIDKFTIDFDSSIIDAAYKIVKNNERTLLVIKKKKVLGTISSGDILRIILKKKNTFMTIENYYNKNFKYLLNKDYNKALKFYKKYNINLIPVVSKKLFIKDIICSKDIVKKINLDK